MGRYINLSDKVRFGIDDEDEERYETYPVEQLKWTPKQSKKEEKEDIILEEITEENDDEEIIE